MDFSNQPTRNFTNDGPPDPDAAVFQTTGYQYNVAPGIDAIIKTSTDPVTTEYIGTRGIFGAIGQLVDTTALYEIGLVDAGTTNPLSTTGLEFNIIFVDIDGLDDGSSPGETLEVFTPLSYDLTATTQVNVSSGAGSTIFSSNNSAANITNPENFTTSLSPLQQDYTVLLTFVEQNTISFSLTTNAVGGPRNFWFEGGTLSIPEPARASFLLIGASAMIVRRRRR